MTRSADLLAACEQGDEARIEQLGWRPVLDALRAWPARLDGRALAPYATLLGDDDPAKVAGAILDMAADHEWRPGAAKVYAWLKGLEPPKPVVIAGARVQPRADTTDRARQSVLMAVAMGEAACACFPRPTHVRVDSDGVLWCPDCHGLEPGQVDQAIEHAT